MIRDVGTIQELLDGGAATVLSANYQPPDGIVAALCISTGQIVVHKGAAFPVVAGKTSLKLFGEQRPSKYAGVLDFPVDDGPIRAARELRHAVIINGSPNYFHFLVFNLPSYLLLSTMPARARMSLAMTQGVPPSLADLVAKLLPTFANGRGLDIVTLEEGAAYDACDVIVPLKSRPFLATFVARRVVIPFVWHRAGVTNPIEQFGPIKLFVRREAETNRRNLVNQAEVEEWFVERGYAPLNPGTLTVDEQVILFSRATHIAGIEGAAMANMLFAVNAVQVVLLASPVTGREEFFATLAKHYGFAFTTIIGDVLVSGVVPRDTDFVVPLAKLDGLRV